MTACVIWVIITCIPHKTFIMYTECARNTSWGWIFLFPEQVNKTILIRDHYHNYYLIYVFMHYILSICINIEMKIWFYFFLWLLTPLLHKLFYLKFVYGEISSQMNKKKYIKKVLTCVSSNIRTRRLECGWIAVIMHIFIAEINISNFLF